MSISKYKIYKSINYNKLITINNISLSLWLREKQKPECKRWKKANISGGGSVLFIVQQSDGLWVEAAW